MSSGALIAILGFSVLVAAGLVTIFAALFGGREEDEIIERRLRDVARTAPDHPGQIVPFERRKP